MNNPFPELTPALRGLLILAQEIGHTYGIPLEAALVQTMAHGSALAGDLISSRPGGKRTVQAKFSILFRTPDLKCPDWIQDELSYLMCRQDEARRLGKPMGPLAARSPTKRIKGLNDNDWMDACENRRIDTLNRLAAYRCIHPVGNGRAPSIQKNAPPVTLSVLGYPAILKILKSRDKPGGYASLIEAGSSERSNVFGWIGDADWKSLIRDAGMNYLSKLGWIVGCPASDFNPDCNAASRVVAGVLLGRLEIARVGLIRLHYQPTDEANSLLVRHDRQVREMLEFLPEFLRERVVPDPFLGWHFSAVLAALCCEGKDGELERAILQSTNVGTVLASWVGMQHVHHFLQVFPADNAGLFDGQDLSVLRFLSAQPRSTRDVQRHLRGASKDSCLQSLQRAVVAGLAVETADRRFIAVPPPPPGPGLSDFLSEFDPSRISPLSSAAKSTDNTDTLGLRNHNPCSNRDSPDQYPSEPRPSECQGVEAGEGEITDA